MGTSAITLSRMGVSETWNNVVQCSGTSNTVARSHQLVVDTETCNSASIEKVLKVRLIQPGADPGPGNFVFQKKLLGFGV